MSIECFRDAPCTAMCCLLVCHGGSLHVPERLIWAGGWHGRWVGSWHGHAGPNSGLSKTHRFNPDYAHHFSLLLSVFPSIDLPPFLPPLPPTHLLSSSLLLLFLLLTSHSSITTLQPTQKTDAPHSLACFHAVTSFHLCP